MAAKLILGVSLLLAALSLVSSTPLPLEQRQTSSTCIRKTQRKSWQNLTAVEKAGYIKATQCIINSPAKLGMPSAKTRWDELQYVHIYNTPFVHGVGAFLPFHRYFITVHERILRDECGYNGSMPYWDEPLDVENFTQSPLFDHSTGLGGNGTGSDHCVRDGPFANLTLRVRENLTASDYCLTRNFNPCLFKSASQSNVDVCFTFKNFEGLRRCLEGNPHGAGHGGINGIMQDVNLSPGDPIFYLHHTYIDKLWWEWQSEDLGRRLTDISGPNIQEFPFGPLPPGTNGTGFPSFGFGAPGNGSGTGLTFDPSCSDGFPPISLPNNTANGSMPGMPMFKPNPALSNYFNDGGDVTTLNHTLYSAVMQNVTIRDVMDIRGDFVCAEYL